MALTDPTHIGYIVGQRIAARRKERSLSQAQLGGMVQLTAARISQIEVGHEANADVYKRITNALGMTLEDLYKGITPAPLNAEEKHDESLRIARAITDNTFAQVDLGYAMGDWGDEPKNRDEAFARMTKAIKEYHIQPEKCAPVVAFIKTHLFPTGKQS